MFLRPKASLDDGDRSPFGNFWFGPSPGRAGGLISNDDALRLTAVYRAVRLLADSMSTLPFKLLKPSATGKGFQSITDHWLVRLINDQPNEYMDPVTYRKLKQSHLELRGNAYDRIVADNRGQIVALLPIHPDRVTVEMLDEYNWRYRVAQRDGSTEYLSRTEVFHRKDFTLNGIVGLNPIACAREALSTGIAAQSYGQRFFENNAQPSGWIEFTGEFKTDQDRVNFREKLQQLWGGRNQGKTGVLDRGMKYHEIKVSNADAQFIESKKFSVSEIARMFGVPPHKLGDLSASTNNNIEQQTLDYINDSLMARIVGWESGMRFDLLGPEAQDYSIQLDLTALMRGDSAARRQYYQSGIQSGWLVRNEAREMEGLNPLDGLDEPLRPLNMVEESAAENAEKGGDKTTEQTLPNSPPPAPPGNDASADRLHAMTAAAVDRIVRKERGLIAKLEHGDSAAAAATAAYERHAEFVAQTLAVPLACAQAYCSAQARALAAGIKSDELEALTRTRLAKLSTERFS